MKMKEPSAVEADTKHVPLLLPDAASTAAVVLAEAMDYCARKMGLASAEVAIERLKRGDHSLCEYCHYSVAQHVAESLGALDQNIKSVYLVDSDDSPDSLCQGNVPPVTPLHLLAWVERKSDGLQAVLQGLDRALAQALAEMIGRSPTAHILDIQVIDDEDVEMRRGYGALLSSLYTRPLKVWER
jgi:hypothetical protein